MHVRSLPTLVGSALLALALVASAPPAGADPEISPLPSADAGLAWLLEQQEADGGFEVADFPLFETPDAIVAIAEGAQTTTTWSTSEALAAVEAVDGGDAGATPLDAIDDYVDAQLTVNLPEDPGDDQDGDVEGGPAAKLIVLVAAPLGLSTTAFDPAGDGNPVDLEEALASDEPPQGAITSVAFAAMADQLTATPDTAGRIDLLRSTQQANGAWNYAGDPTWADDDVDTTGFILNALIRAGLPASDATVEGAVRFLAGVHRDSGAWEFHSTFDNTRTPNVNSTALGTFGLEAAGWDQADTCWRTTNNPGSGSRPYVSPAAYIESQQVDEPAPDAGRFLSPNDTFGISTQPTSQAIQGLFRTWLPLERAALQPLAPLDAFTDVPDCAYYSRAVSWMATEEITTGYEDDTFRPAAGMTRQAIAAQLFRFADPTFTPPAEATFDDVSTSHPFFEEIEWMVAEGITTGYPDDTFRPGTAVNRQQAAAFLYRIAGEPEVPDGAPTFPDVSASHPFSEEIGWMAGNRLTNPYPDGTFKPGTALNRGQLSTFLFRLASTEPAWDESADIPSAVLFDL